MLRDLPWLFVSTLAVACGGKAISPNPDAASPRDGSRPDDSMAKDSAPPVDAGPRGDAEVGGSCDAGGQCASGYCLGWPFMNGYCAIPIAECPAPGATMNPCPAGTLCTRVGGAIVPDGGTSVTGDFCLKACTPGVADECRTINEGYTCCQTLQSKPACITTYLCSA
jgi:hypothetical protein